MHFLISADALLICLLAGESELPISGVRLAALMDDAWEGDRIETSEEGLGGERGFVLLA